MINDNKTCLELEKENIPFVFILTYNYISTGLKQIKT